MEQMLLRLLLFGFCFSITYQGWITPVESKKYPVYNNTIKITTDSVYRSGDEVHFYLFTNTGSWITSIIWRLKDWVYTIPYCNSYYSKRRFTTQPPAAVNKTWEVYKAATYLNIKCNGVTVLHYVYSHADENPDCGNNLNYKTVATVEVSPYDSATRKFYLDDTPGCRGFEAEWMIKGIENSTDIEVPIPYQTVVPIKCTGSNSKLSGPDNITCLENNTFSGLSDIYCSVDKPGTCPRTHPFVFGKRNRLCCKYNKEKNDPTQGAACDGSPIHPGSLCCHEDAYVKCPLGEGCTNYR